MHDVWKFFCHDVNHYIWSTSTFIRFHDSECLTCVNFSLVLLWSIRLHVPVSVTECTIDYSIEMACICICALLCFYHVRFYVLIIMSVIKWHRMWSTLRDMCLEKCFIISIIIVIQNFFILRCLSCCYLALTDKEMFLIFLPSIHGTFTKCTWISICHRIRVHTI